MSVSIAFALRCVTRKLRAVANRLVIIAFRIGNWSRKCCGFSKQVESSVPKVTARAYYILSMDTGCVIAQKHAALKLPPASTIKLMTAMVLIRQKHEYELDAKVRICASDVARPIGSNVGLLPGDVISYIDLLHLLLVASANDAARAIARNIGKEIVTGEKLTGNPIACFVETMNTYGKSIGMTDTRCQNPSGLDELGQYTTAKDLASLGDQAFREQQILQAISKTDYMAAIEGPNARYVTVNNTLERDPRIGLVGGKTGTSSQARSCLVALLNTKPAKTYIVAILSCKKGHRINDLHALSGYYRL